MKLKKWIKENTTSLKGVKIAITGATGGLGEHVATTLVKLGATLFLLARNEEKTKALIKKISLIYPNANLQYIYCDLTNFESVKSATQELKIYEIDMLFHNSGIYNVPRTITSIGFDNVFQVNFLMPYYMTKELLPTLNKSKFGKVMVTGSVAHNYSKFNKSDIQFLKEKKSSKVYGNSKRMLMFSLYELMKNQNCKLSIAHPGVTLTNMTNHYPKCINWLVKIGIKLLFPSNEKAIRSLIKAVFDETDYHEWIGPSIFNVWGKPKKQKLKTCSEEESNEIFTISENLYSSLTK
ncbi:MAG: SDR family NAD(P)-dependent oxidoreductase [Clostridiales bacterium]|nr:SDR family NAD(P)-dependent oxidoreductase [Clostridiales bacterium]